MTENTYTLTLLNWSEEELGTLQITKGSESFDFSNLLNVSFGESGSEGYVSISTKDIEEDTYFLKINSNPEQKRKFCVYNHTPLDKRLMTAKAIETYVEERVLEILKEKHLISE